MTIKKWWDKQSLFTRYFLFVFVVITLSVASVEIFVEAWVADFLGFDEDDMHGWHEALLWGVSILIPSLIGGYILARTLSGKLDKIARMAHNLANGNLEARLPANPESKDAFNQLMCSLNNMADALSHLLHNERKLLLDISHELRSPLTRLRISSALLQDSGDLNESKELAARLEKDLEYMGGLIGSLLSQGKSTLNAAENPEPVDMQALLAGLADDFAFQGKAQQKKLQASIAKNVAVYGRPTLLRSILGNVLANAIFYTPKGSKVLLQSSVSEEDLVVIIRDFGPGVPENHLEDIFRPFYRLDDSRSKDSGGAGLGLALAKEAALSHGGGISAANAQPGLEVRIVLPLYRPDDFTEIS